MSLKTGAGSKKLRKERVNYKFGRNLFSTFDIVLGRYFFILLLSTKN
jgi:hypothetical protein